MLKNFAAKKLSIIPALTGSSRSRPIQELLAAEELILHSLQGLRTGFDKTSEALKAWTCGKDVELENTLSACSKLLEHWILSFEPFATHISHIRESMKARLPSEETLESLYRHKKSLISKADPLEKKALGQTGFIPSDELQLLRREIFTTGLDIQYREARLGSKKSGKTRDWMRILFRGLLECSGKGTVIATIGHAIIGDLSTESTKRGFPQLHHSGQSQVESFVTEAQRRLDISFVGRVSGEAQPPSNENRIDANVQRHPPTHHVPPTFPSMRDTVTNGHGDTTNTGNRSLRRAKPIGRSQTHGHVGNGRSQAPLRPTLSQGAEPLVSDTSEHPKRSGKKSITLGDVTDRHDFSGAGLMAGPSNSVSVNRVRVRQGYWNRRGDCLAHDRGAFVRAPPQYQYPREFSHYHGDDFFRYDGRKIAWNPEMRESEDSMSLYTRPPRYPFEHYLRFIEVDEADVWSARAH